MADAQNIASTLDAEVDLSSEYVRSVSEALAAGDNESMRFLVRDLRPLDLADLIKLLNPASGLRSSLLWVCELTTMLSPSLMRPIF